MTEIKLQNPDFTQINYSLLGTRMKPHQGICQRIIAFCASAYEAPVLPAVGDSVLAGGNIWSVSV